MTPLFSTRRPHYPDDPLTRQEIGPNASEYFTPGSRQRREATGAWEGRVALAAYRRAEARGFIAGHDLEDWLAAEAELRAAMYTD